MHKVYQRMQLIIKLRLLQQSLQDLLPGPTDDEIEEQNRLVGEQGIFYQEPPQP